MNKHLFLRNLAFPSLFRVFKKYRLALKFSDIYDIRGSLDQMTMGSGLVSPTAVERQTCSREGSLPRPVFGVAPRWEGEWVSQESTQKEPGTHKRNPVPSHSASAGRQEGFAAVRGDGRGGRRTERFRES